MGSLVVAYRHSLVLIYVGNEGSYFFIACPFGRVYVWYSHMDTRALALSSFVKDELTRVVSLYGFHARDTLAINLLSVEKWRGFVFPFVAS